jgi:hypothetical protein
VPFAIKIPTFFSVYQRPIHQTILPDKHITTSPALPLLEPVNQAMGKAGGVSIRAQNRRSTRPALAIEKLVTA